MLNDIVNFTFASSKHHFELKLTKKYEFRELIITGELENVIKANEASILHQPETTS